MDGTKTKTKSITLSFCGTEGVIMPPKIAAILPCHACQEVSKHTVLVPLSLLLTATSCCYTFLGKQQVKNDIK
jgi:hypothetical protein